MTHRVLNLVKTRPTPGQITDLAARPQHESGDPHPRLDAPPESLGGTMRFHRRGIYAHAAPHSLGSISRASTPLRALSTRKRPNRGKWTSKINQACANCPRTTLTRELTRSLHAARNAALTHAAPTPLCRGRHRVAAAGRPRCAFPQKPPCVGDFACRVLWTSSLQEKKRTCNPS